MSAVWHDIACFINENEIPQVFIESDIKPSFSPTFDDIHTDLLDDYVAIQADSTRDTVQNSTLASCPSGNNGDLTSVDLFSNWSPASYPADEIQKVVREIVPSTEFHENKYSPSSPEMQDIMQELLALPAGQHTDSAPKVYQEVCTPSAQDETQAQTIKEYLESVTFNDEISDPANQIVSTVPQSTEELNSTQMSCVSPDQQGMETQIFQINEIQTSNSSDPQAPPTYVFPITIEYVGFANPQDTPKETPHRKGARKTKKLTTFTSHFNCEKCMRSFKSKGGLLQHNQQIHSGPTPHACDHCGKRYRDIDTMQQHRQRHLMKDKPCKCEECPKQFIRLSDLQRHVQLHHRVSRHSCDICGKAFDRADHLKNHKLSHLNGTVKRFKNQQVM
ncbi:zinc finger and BTB domain-containing protein 14-like [Armigeres subalbatus]|uniref:zinc finger and BTB domain-containing protein 14-like n=1 Tax=Armigeres subalbatus TaxID=124917 RepID=UPI002ED4429F